MGFGGFYTDLLFAEGAFLHSNREPLRKLSWQREISSLFLKTKISSLFQISSLLQQKDECNFQFSNTVEYKEHWLGRSEKIQTDKYIIMIMTMKMIVIMVMNTFARELPLHSSPPDIVRQMLGEKAEASMPYFFHVISQY